MPQRRASPMIWSPKGLSDVLDSTNAFRGAMSMLQNLIPDPTTPGLWQCRPASIPLLSFGGAFSSGFSSGFLISGVGAVGQISCLLIVGNLAFGMVGSSAIAGHDTPFCFNLLTNTLVTIGGTITAATTPVSQPTTGDWTAPQIELVGSKVVVTHIGFSGVGGAFVGFIDISNPGAPVWSAGNFTWQPGGSGPIDFQFAQAPTGIAQFNGRAYYIYNLPAQPAVVFSDINNPLTNTGTLEPIITFGDNVPLTAIAGLPLGNQVIGGVIQSLIVFKQVVGMYQVTGDSAAGTLASNSLNVQTGTFAPNGIAATPRGLAFIAPDGLRIIDFYARVSDPIGIDGKGVNVPFQLIVTPTRAQLACNANVLRISLKNGNIANAPTQEYWYDFARQIFHGPHTFPAAMIGPYQNTFIISPTSAPTTLYRSDTIQSLTSIFEEAGQQLMYSFETTFLPSNQNVTNNTITESTIDLQLASGVPPINISAINWRGNVLDTVSIASAGGGTIWGSFTWGGAVWGGPVSQLVARQMQWHLPLTFVKMLFQVQGQSALAVKIGKIEAKVVVSSMLTDINAAA